MQNNRCFIVIAQSRFLQLDVFSTKYFLLLVSPPPHSYTPPSTHPNSSYSASMVAISCWLRWRSSSICGLSIWLGFRCRQLSAEVVRAVLRLCSSLRGELGRRGVGWCRWSLHCVTGNNLLATLPY